MNKKTELLCTICFERITNDRSWRTRLTQHMRVKHDKPRKASAAKLKELYTKIVPPSTVKKKIF